MESRARRDFATLCDGTDAAWEPVGPATGSPRGTPVQKLVAALVVSAIGTAAAGAYLKREVGLVLGLGLDLRQTLIVVAATVVAR